MSYQNSLFSDLVTDGAIHAMDFGGLPSAYLVLEAENFHRGECSAIIYSKGPATCLMWSVAAQRFFTNESTLVKHVPGEGKMYP